MESLYPLTICIDSSIGSLLMCYQPKHSLRLKLGSGIFFFFLSLELPGTLPFAKRRKQNYKLLTSKKQKESQCMKNANVQKQLRTIKWLKTEVLEPDCLGSNPSFSTNCETLKKLRIFSLSQCDLT